MIRVSAIVPVYNGAATVADAIRSALAQTFSALEIIVVDDGSTDSTPAVLEQFGDRIRVIRQSNAGSSAARNQGAAAAAGEYLAFLDADDLWEPQMAERCAAALDAHPECVMAFANLALVDSDGRDLGARLIGSGFDHAPKLEEMLVRLWPIMPSAMMVRRAAYESTGGFDARFRFGFEDVEFALRLRELGAFWFIPEPLAKWRFAFFPRQFKTGWQRPEAVALLDRTLRERYGVSAGVMIAGRARASRSILGYIGLRALGRGDRAAAREAFRRALKLDPWRMRNLMRYLRTYLPPSLARAVSGRTGAAGR
jgi:glycosyltransferase involved in cell wall biosynthesis